MRYFLLHKPRGCITSTVDDAGRDRTTVYQVAKAAGIPNFGPVGRLDLDTSGVLIFTNDCKLKKAISSPYYKGKAEVGTVPSMEKVYHALIAGTIRPDEKGVQLMREPLHFSRKMDGPGGSWTRPAEVRVLETKNFSKGQPVPWRFKPGTTATITWLEVVLREGKNRQIRRLCRRSDFELTRLHRVAVGPIVLGDLKEGCCRELTRREVEALYKRCLPKDPLCLTVNQIRAILTYCLERAARTEWTRPRSRQHLQSETGGDTTREIQHGSEYHQLSRPPPCVALDSPKEGRVMESAEHELQNRRGEFACGNKMEILQGALRHIIEYSLRDLHEAPEGPDGECGQPELCPEEGDSLRRARAVAPNEAHMLCGYRSSQIDRLP